MVSYWVISVRSTLAVNSVANATWLTNNKNTKGIKAKRFTIALLRYSFLLVLIGDIDIKTCAAISYQDYREYSVANVAWLRSEEHTSELQSRPHLVCRLLLEKKKK